LQKDMGRYGKIVQKELTADLKADIRDVGKGLNDACRFAADPAGAARNVEASWKRFQKTAGPILKNPKALKPMLEKVASEELRGAVKEATKYGAKTPEAWMGNAAHAVHEGGKSAVRNSLDRGAGKALEKLERLSHLVGRLEKTEKAVQKAAGAEKRAGRNLPPQLADVCSAQERRTTPGRAWGGEHLPVAKEGWMRGTDQNAGKIPRQVADKLRGQEFGSFNWKKRADGKMRKDPNGLAGRVWKEIAANPELAKEFAYDKRNLRQMEKGNAPFVRPSQRVRKKGKDERYQIHHASPIHRGGDVYNFDNLQIVTPAYHESALDTGYHYGK
jgi:hypothetical protein